MTINWTEMATSVENGFVTNWKISGKPVVGYTCSYMPDEIFHSAEILPYRLHGSGAQECSIGDTYFGPFICSMPKHMLQLVGEGSLRFLDGAIITPGCDSMRRLDECWRKAGEDIKDIVPPFFFHFGVPHKFSDYTIKWFKDEIYRLIEALKAHFSVTISDSKLADSIRVYNRGRELLRAFEHLRASPYPPLSGVDALAVILAGLAMTRHDYNDALATFIEELESRPKANDERIRLMLIGSANDDLELVKLIEGNRARVVADNLCFSARSHLGPVDESDDPINALARHYLSKNECPRMYGQYQARLKIIKDKIETAGVEGVVLQNIRFCDMHGAENGLFSKDLETAGIPCLRIEREYGPLVEKGRLKIRIDAFLENITRQKDLRK
jgi:benzoyl-CoA reductase/2-hydroxyglutaryl-CoA dehydratase subunit BcrC/BadD/HgdB